MRQGPLEVSVSWRCGAIVDHVPRHGEIRRPQADWWALVWVCYNDWLWGCGLLDFGAFAQPTLVLYCKRPTDSAPQRFLPTAAANAAAHSLGSYRYRISKPISILFRKQALRKCSLSAPGHYEVKNTVHMAEQMLWPGLPKGPGPGYQQRLTK
jgi:hypothetical protein